MWPAILIIVYCVLVVLASLLGGWLPSLVQLTHTRMQLTMSFVSGLMLGIALLHLLPHAIEFLPSMSWLAGSMLVGLLSMFFLLRIFHVHQHGTLANGNQATPTAPDHEHEHDSHEHEHGAHDHGHAHAHQHGNAHVHHHEPHTVSVHPRRLNWAGLAFGLALHSMMDGIALGASVVADAGTHSTAVLLGLGTFLAVLLHKPLDALSITSVMTAGGWTDRGRAMVNAAFALTCPLGALLFWFGTMSLQGGTNNLVIGCALAYSAGLFLCISLGDLLPEVHFHTHDRLALSIALLLGVGFALLIEIMPGHSHQSHPTAPHTHEQRDVHSHDDHDPARHPE